MNRFCVYLCFFLSGLSGLMNEVVWSRLFVYTIGSSHLSIALVVSVFMGGLALGSLWGGRLASRVASPLRLYGVLVLLAGLLAGAVVPLLWLAEPLLSLAYRFHDGSPSHPLFTVVKLAICTATILVPTTLMGATLPALAEHLTKSPSEAGARLGALYAANTLGAVTGTFGAGFFLIGRLGLGWTAVLAAAVDVLVGVAVLVAVRRESAAARAASPAPSPAQPGKTVPAGAREPGASATSTTPVPEAGIPWPVKIAVLAFGLSGFVNMCFQLGWTRALIISIGNSTYAFSVIVGIFILGLAIGGWLAGLFTDRLRNPIAAFGWVLIATSAAAVLTIPELGFSPARLAWQIADGVKQGDFGFGRFLLLGAGWAAILILPATILMGMTLPIAARLRAIWSQGIGRAVGAAYAANTTGAILGTALTGFFLVPALGRVDHLLYLAAALGVAAGAVVLVAAPGGRRPRRLAAMGVTVALLFGFGLLTSRSAMLGKVPVPGISSSSWHPVVLSLGAYKNYQLARNSADAEAYARDMIAHWDSLYYRDGEAASVAVLRKLTDGLICLNIAGKVESSANVDFSFDLQTQLLSGYLPLLVHSQPKRVLNLGLGGGITLGAITSHPGVEEVDLLELVPEVVEAARIYFAEANKNSLKSPKVRAIIGDGRNHLAYTARTYDVISSQPSNFWIAGLGNLFTEEFYHLVQSRLNPGGIFCQWIYGYNIALHDYQTALRTFLRFFPEALVFTNTFGDTILLGSKDRLSIRRDLLARALAEPPVKADLAPIGISEPAELFRYFQGQGKDFVTWVGDGPTNRDFNPVLEFSSPFGYFSKDPAIAEALAAVAAHPIPAGVVSGFSPEELALGEKRRAAGRSLTRFVGRLGQPAEAVEEYRALAAQEDPWARSYAAHELAVRASALGADRADFLQQAREAYDEPELCLADGGRLLKERDAAGQFEVLRRAAAESPAGRWHPLLALATLEARTRRVAEAEKSLESAVARGAPAYKVEAVRGLILRGKGDFPGAEAAFTRALETTPPKAKPDRPEAYYYLALSREDQGRAEEALVAFAAFREAGGDQVRAGIAASRCLRRLGRFDSAAASALEATQAAERLGRPSGEAYAEQARAAVEMGRIAEAIRLFERAVMHAPGRFEEELSKLKERAGGSRT